MAPANRPRRVPPLAIAALLYFIVLSAVFHSVLSGQETSIHGDALSVGLPLQQLLSETIAAGSFPLWSNQIYGGHPIFAEGQGGFAHPLNLLLFGLLPLLGPERDASQIMAASTLYAHGIYHLLCGWIAAMGTFGLARTVGLGLRASLVAGLALACSQGWLGLTLNSTIAGATAWAPLLLLCVERWWRDPSLSRALELSGSITLVLLAGYPQALHATAIFALVSILVRIRRGWFRSPWRHLSTGLIAIVGAAALSAIQLLPTLELVDQSIRAEGIALYHSDEFVTQLRGLLITIGGRLRVVPGLGSTLLFGLALLAIRPSRKILSLLLPTLLLFQLGLANNSPVFRALHHVLPGLDRFRIASMYPTIGLIGVALLAGFGIEALAKHQGSNRIAWAGLLGTALCVALAACATHIAATPGWNYGIPAAALLATSALIMLGRASRIPSLMLALVVLEILLLRLPLHNFVALDVVREPPATVRFLLDRHPEHRSFKIANAPHTHDPVTFATPDDPRLARFARRFLSSLGGGSNLIWSIPSIDANLALPLSRRSAATPLIEAGTRGESQRPPGQRFIDSIGLRYLISNAEQHDEPFSTDFVEVFSEGRIGFFIRENPHAQSIFRIYPASLAQWVDDYPAAISAWQRPKGASLLLEGEPPQGWDPEDFKPSTTGYGSIERAISFANGYSLEVSSPGPSFLFVADSPYPGWTASISGKPVSIYAANVLGKAIALPAGNHTVLIEFDPQSFRVGATVSLMALTTGAALWLAAWKSKRRAAC